MRFRMSAGRRRIVTGILLTISAALTATTVGRRPDRRPDERRPGLVKEGDLSAHWTTMHTWVTRLTLA